MHLQEKQGDITEDETVRFKSYLLSLGIDDPVTRGAYSNQNEYFKSLSRQLAQILEDPIKVSAASSHFRIILYMIIIFVNLKFVIYRKLVE